MRPISNTLRIIYEAVTCVISYFLIEFFISVLAYGGIAAIIGGVLLAPLTLGVVLSGLLSNGLGIIKSIATRQKWYWIILRILIFIGFIASIVLSVLSYFG